MYMYRNRYAGMKDMGLAVVINLRWYNEGSERCTEGLNGFGGFRCARGKIL